MTLDLDKRDWERTTLGAVAKASKERVDPQDGTVSRYVAGDHMDTDDLKIHRWGEIGDGYLGPAFHRPFNPGQVLYGSRRTYLRKVAVAAFSGVTANTTFVVETRDPSVLLQEFLPFVMTSELFHAFSIRESKGSVNPYVNWTDIERYEFDLPPIDEQKRIADLLWSFEVHRRALQAIKAALTQTSESRFRGLIGSEGWPLVAIEDLVLAGPTNGKSASSNDQRRGIPTLSIGAIREGTVLGGKNVKHIDVSPEDFSAFVIQKDDFLIVRGNGNKQLTGRGGLAIGGLPDGCVYPDLLIRLQFDRSKILPEFAALQWNTAATHGRLVRKAKSTNGIWKVNGKDIKSHRLVTPPLATQERIVNQTRVIENATGMADVEAGRLSDFYGRLCADVFGGGR